jgi:hypothetical protein
MVCGPQSVLRSSLLNLSSCRALLGLLGGSHSAKAPLRSVSEGKHCSNIKGTSNILCDPPPCSRAGRCLVCCLASSFHKLSLPAGLVEGILATITVGAQGLLCRGSTESSRTGHDSDTKDHFSKVN